MPALPSQIVNRVRQPRRDVLTKYGPQARAVLDALLAKYADEGVLNLDDANVLKIAPFSAMGSVVQLIKAFGNRQDFEHAVHELQSALYQEAATYCASVKDYPSRDLFEELMADEEGHIDFLETQLDLVDKLGLQLYAQGHMGKPGKAED